MFDCVSVAGFVLFFFFNDTATTEIYTLSLHDALPICDRVRDGDGGVRHDRAVRVCDDARDCPGAAERLRQRARSPDGGRSEEHTSELQSRLHLVCRLLLEKKRAYPGSSACCCGFAPFG